MTTAQTLRRFGPALRNCRQAAGLSQNQLARRLGTTQGHVSRIERGQARPSLRMALALAQFFAQQGDPALLSTLTEVRHARAV